MRTPSGTVSSHGGGGAGEHGAGKPDAEGEVVAGAHCTDIRATRDRYPASIRSTRCLCRLR